MTGQRGINAALDELLDIPPSEVDKTYLTEGTGPGGKYCHRDFRRATGLFALESTGANAVTRSATLGSKDFTSQLKTLLASQPSLRIAAWLDQNESNKEQISRLRKELISYVENNGKVPVLSPGADKDMWRTQHQQRVR
jgi:hypothetical protein